MPVLKYKLNGEWITLSGGPGAGGGSNVEIDPSLTVEGAAADAKAAGDAIIGLGEALGEGLANVVTQEQLGEALAPIVEGMGEIGIQIEGRQSKAILSATQPTNWQNGDIWLKPAE